MSNEPENDENDDELDRIVVVDDEGNEINCAILAVAEIDGIDYALLAEEESLDDEENETLELLIFEYTEEDEAVVLTGIESEETFEKVREFFSELMENQSDDDEE
jgi:uncharacterized protein YrzB (UPF0473 family)